MLLRKFEGYGFGKKAVALLRKCLTDRTQRCQLNGMLSHQRGITCGIPEGSILGPLLFIIYIYIYDLPSCLEHTTPRMFADDASLTAVGKTLNIQSLSKVVGTPTVSRYICLSTIIPSPE